MFDNDQENGGESDDAANHFNRDDLDSFDRGEDRREQWDWAVDDVAEEWDDGPMGMDLDRSNLKEVRTSSIKPHLDSFHLMSIFRTPPKLRRRSMQRLRIHCRQSTRKSIRLLRVQTTLSKMRLLLPMRHPTSFQMAIMMLLRNQSGLRRKQASFKQDVDVVSVKWCRW